MTYEDGYNETDSDYNDTSDDTNDSEDLNGHYYILLFGWYCAVCAVAISLIFTSTFSKWKCSLYTYFSTMHLLIGFMHLSLALLMFESSTDNITQVENVIILSTSLLTLCLSLLTFLKLYVKNDCGDSLSKNEITVFFSSALSMLVSYEEFLSSDIVFGDVCQGPALVLTMVLVLLTAPFMILSLISKSLLTKSDEIPWRVLLFFAAHISIFLISDGLMMIYIWANDKLGIVEIKTVTALLIIFRLLLECIWLNVSSCLIPGILSRLIDVVTEDNVEIDVT